MKITPVLIVDKIEPILPFWVDRLGFEKTVEVPNGDGLAFVIFQHGTAELMFQTQASAERDVPQIAGQLKPRPGTFIEVDDFDDLLKRVEGLEVVMPERTTFYGMREIMVREPGGNIICFAAKV
jgi:uncharacterized glyoxalase superfamily protein PhnB